MKPAHHRQGGFTLVEIGVALVALGIVLLGAVVFWQQSTRVRVSAEQTDVRQQVREALTGFAYAQHRLPCPAADTNGNESCALGGGSVRQVGYVPWRTMGLPRPDAGQLRYGVYREPSATAAQDRDLATAIDRMNPLRVKTPSPTPQNGTAPNGNAPPFPSASPQQLGATQSGNDSAPLNSSCDATNAPPCPATPVAQASNQIDFCLALNTMFDSATAPTSALGVLDGASRRAAAFVLASPGLLDSDGDGNFFDGANATATDTAPTFEAVDKQASTGYDDQVMAVSAAELFTSLNCGAGLSAASHSHFNTATAGFVMERALYDYRDQLYIQLKLAQAGRLSAIAGVTGAAAGISDAAQAMMAAIGDTTLSAGARSFQIGLAAAGIAAAAAGAVTAGIAMADAEAAVSEAQDTWDDFAVRTTAMTTLAASININALKADAIGY